MRRADGQQWRAGLRPRSQGHRMRRVLAASFALIAAAGLGAGCARGPIIPGRAAGSESARMPIALPPTGLTEQQQALHVLDRLGYGPRPGDVERIRLTGGPLISSQLDPASMTDGGDIAARTVSMSPLISGGPIRARPPCSRRSGPAR
jgi:hypothetical protein